MRHAERTDAASRARGGRRGSVLKTALLAAALLLGAVFVFSGIARGEVPVILAKATSICYQCIGIG